MFCKQDMNHLLLDLLGLDSINDRIQHRWGQNADISQQDVDMRWDVAPKPLSKSCEDPRPIEEDNDANMGATSVESFVASILGGHAEDSTEDQHIGNKNQHNI